MKSILLVVVLVVACQAQDKCDCQWTTAGLGEETYLSMYGLASSNLDVQSIRIFQMQRWVDRLRKKLDDAVSTHKASTANQLLMNIERIEGSGCRPGEFQCGGDLPKCISNLLVCDGDAECLNGADESERICSVAPLTGTVWEGRLYWKACKLRGDEVFRLSIISNKRKNYFKPGVWVTASIAVEYEENGTTRTESFLVEGHYFRATTRLVLNPVNDRADGISIFCQVVRADATAFCHMVKRGNVRDVTICATAQVKQVK